MSTIHQTPKLNRVQSPPDTIIPHTYVAYKHSQLCRCGHLHVWTEMMAETHLRSGLGLGKYVTNQRTCRSIEEVHYNLPIKLMEAPLKRVLFCHECYATATLSHLPSPPIPAAVVGMRDPAQPGASAKQRKPAKPFTAEDI